MADTVVAMDVEQKPGQSGEVSKNRRPSIDMVPDMVRLKNNPEIMKDPHNLAIIFCQIIVAVFFYFLMQKPLQCLSDTGTGVTAPLESCPDWRDRDGHSLGVGTKTTNQANIIIFTAFVGFGVGLEVKFEQFKDVLTNNKIAFCIGCFSQFIMMPLFGLLMSLIFESTLLREGLGSGFYKLNDWDPVHKGMLGAAVGGVENVPAWNDAETLAMFGMDGLPKGKTILRSLVADGTYLEGDGAEHATWIVIPEFETMIILSLVLACSCPGGTTSNSFTVLNKGDVPLSVTMSVVSNICSLFWIPLNIILFYELRYPGDGGKVDYIAIFEPLGVLVGFLVVGMMVRIQCTGEQGLIGNPWNPDLCFVNSRVAILISNVYIFYALGRSLDIFCINAPPGQDVCAMIAPNPAFLFITIALQPIGAAIGWGLAVASKQGIRQRIAISYETGIQAFGVGLAVGLLMYEDVEKDVYAFLDNDCAQPAEAGPFGAAFYQTCLGCIAACTPEFIGYPAVVPSPDGEGTMDNPCAACAPYGLADPATWNAVAQQCGPPHAFGTSFCKAPFNMLPIQGDPGVGNPDIVNMFTGRFYDSVLFSFFGSLVYCMHLVWMWALFWFIRTRYHADEYAEADEVEDSKA